MKDIAYEIKRLYDSSKADLLKIIDNYDDLWREHYILMLILLLVVIVLVFVSVKLAIDLLQMRKRHYLFQRELREDVKLFYTPRKKSH